MRILLPLLLVIGFGTAAQAQVSNINGTIAPPPGAVWVQAGIESQLKTYKYSSLANTPAATPTDIFTITGSATRTIRITKIVIGGLATTAGQLNPLLIRRSAANSGGTSSAPTPLKRDTNDSAATATLALYTANPTVGTTVGTLDSCRLFLALATATPNQCKFEFGVNNDKMLLLRGTSDILAINFAGATVPAGGVVDIDVEWVEEP